MRSLLEAHPSLTDAHVRRQSILLGRILLVLTLLFAGVDAALLISTPGYEPPWPGYVLSVGDPILSTGRRPGDYVRLSVSDTGSGMDAATRRRIFEPFFTTKPRGKGTGLGLAMVFGTVSQSGGFIDVSSEPGKGTRFELYFPRSESQEDVASPPAKALTSGNETLLLVEDDVSVRKVIELVLREAGYRVLAAGSATEARALWPAHARDIALVITDEVMPGGRGTDLVAELRSERPDLRALSISGYAEPEGASAATELSIARIQKPFELEDLLSQVRSLLDVA